MHLILSLILFFNPFGDKTPASGARHDFHTSLTEINYNPASKSLEITIRVFTDDLESALMKFGGKKVFINTTTKDKHDPLIEQYVSKHFALLSPQKELKKGEYLGRETEADATWLYYEIPNCQSIKGYTLMNDIMQELFDDQTNLVNIIYPKDKKTIIYNAKVKSSVFPF
ncbi:hypothetical protein GVN16_15635 [Emticicia sp. CRIBPO]|uniref:DUF6702 family protein n=1 Tax=Emticicia sp. CRIBPO TaxID=2683258 RepID=UPI0014135D40|nr:DUF6702 family protein [Emticicia sp. CRIBPO]NBA87204.1 hypothetical protein [Emticicia sp. CRIBPO]